MSEIQRNIPFYRMGNVEINFRNAFCISLLLHWYLLLPSLPGRVVTFAFAFANAVPLAFVSGFAFALALPSPLPLPLATTFAFAFAVAFAHFAVATYQHVCPA